MREGGDGRVRELSQSKKLDMLALVQFPLSRKKGVSISGDPVNAKLPKFELPCPALEPVKTDCGVCLSWDSRAASF